MHPFVETISIVGAFAVAFVGVVVALTLFYRGLSWLSGDARPEEIRVRGVLKKGTRVTVHMSGSKTFENVRFLGFTSQSMKTNLPFELAGMVVLEDANQTRFLIRAKDIRQIEVPPEAPRSPGSSS